MGKKWKSFLGNLGKKQHLEPFCNQEQKDESAQLFWVLLLCFEKFCLKERREGRGSRKEEHLQLDSPSRHCERSSSHRHWCELFLGAHTSMVGITVLVYNCTMIWVMIEASLQSIPIPLWGNLHFSELSSAVPHDWSLQTKASFTLDIHLQNKKTCPRIDCSISWRIQTKLHRVLSNSWGVALLC